MKFICDRKNKLLGGFYSSIVNRGHDWYWLDNKPIFDVFDEEQPDVIMVSELNTTMLKCLQERSNHDRVCGNDVVIISNDMYKLYIGHTACTICELVDTFSFTQTDVEQNLACDLAAINHINDTIKSLCYPVGKFNIKLFGDDNGGGYGVAQFLGRITHSEMCQVYASSLLTYVSDHAEAMAVTLCGGCPIGYNIDERFGINIDDIDELTDLIHTWDNNPSLREQTTKSLQQYLKDYPEHTYEYQTTILLEKINEQRDYKTQ